MCLAAEELTEEDVIAAVCDLLVAAGWTIEQRLTTTQQGIDIVARAQITPRRLSFCLRLPPSLLRNRDLDVSRRSPPLGAAAFPRPLRWRRGLVDLEDLAVIAGRLPPRALRLVVEWAREHDGELRENWERARRHEPLEPIDPLR